MKPYLFLWELKVFVKLFYVRLVTPHDPVIGKKILLIFHLDQSLCPFLDILAPPVSRTGMFPPNWKQLSGTVNLGKNLEWIHKHPTTRHRYYAQCKGGISCGKRLL